MKNGARKLIPAALSVVIAAACGFLPQEDDVKLPSLPEPPRIAQSITYPVQRADLFEAIQGTARVNPTRMRQLYFLVSGRVQEVRVEPNQTVKAGERLAKLEIDALEHQLAIARIDRDIARANLEIMAARGVSAVERRIQDLQVQKHDLNVSYLQGRVEAAIIRAPFDGVVVRVQAKVSDLVREYEPVVEVSDPRELELQMNVTESEYYNIEPTMAVEVEYQTDRWDPAVIVQTTHLNPRQDATVRRDEFIVHLRLRDPSLKIELYNRFPARIVLTRRENTLVIPAAGLREFSGRSYVRVLEGEIRREIDVKVGIRTETRVEILEGLEEGELVIGR